MKIMKKIGLIFALCVLTSNVNLCFAPSQEEELEATRLIYGDELTMSESFRRFCKARWTSLRKTVAEMEKDEKIGWALTGASGALLTLVAVFGKFTKQKPFLPPSPPLLSDPNKGRPRAKSLSLSGESEEPGIVLIALDFGVNGKKEARALLLKDGQELPDGFVEPGYVIKVERGKSTLHVWTRNGDAGERLAGGYWQSLAQASWYWPEYSRPEDIRTDSESEKASPSASLSEASDSDLENLLISLPPPPSMRETMDVEFDGRTINNVPVFEWSVDLLNTPPQSNEEFKIALISNRFLEPGFSRSQLQPSSDVQPLVEPLYSALNFPHPSELPVPPSYNSQFGSSSSSSSSSEDPSGKGKDLLREFPSAVVLEEAPRVKEFYDPFNFVNGSPQVPMTTAASEEENLDIEKTVPREEVVSGISSNSNSSSSLSSLVPPVELEAGKPPVILPGASDVTPFVEPCGVPLPSLPKSDENKFGFGLSSQADEQAKPSSLVTPPPNPFGIAIPQPNNFSSSSVVVEKVVPVQTLDQIEVNRWSVPDRKGRRFIKVTHDLAIKVDVIPVPDGGLEKGDVVICKANRSGEWIRRVFDGKTWSIFKDFSGVDQIFAPITR